MALTWREVTAPKLDTRDLALAGQSIGASFDKLGDMFIKREENLRTEATDAAIARALALQDPDAVSKLASQGVAGLDKRVNARSYMEALGLRQNQLIDTAKKNEEYLNLKAVGELGDEGQAFVSMFAKGDREGALKYAAELSKGNPLWGRVAYQFGLDGEKAFDVYTDNVEGERNNRAQNAASQTSANAAALNARTNREQVLFDIGRRRTQDAKAAAEEARALALNADADRVAGVLLSKGHTDVGEIAVGIKRSDKYNNLKTAAEKDSYLNAVIDRVTNKTTRSAKEQEALGMPLFRSVYADAGAQADITKNVLTKQFNDSNPNLAITEAVSARKAPATQKEAVLALEGMLNSSSWLTSPATYGDVRLLREAIADRKIDPSVVVELLRAEDLRPGMFKGAMDFFDRAQSATEYLNNGNPLLDRGTRDAMLKDVTRVERDLARAMRDAEEYLRNSKPVPATLSKQVRELSRQAQTLRQKPPEK